jgi:predicted helicase
MNYQFFNFINDNNINDFSTFIYNLSYLTTEQKGTYFEYFCSLYFIILMINKTDFIEFYLYKDIPSLIKKLLCLPLKDKGIDAIVIDKYNNVYAIQCKFRSDNKKISFSELSTFSALTFGSDIKVNGGILFSNCIDVCDELKNDKYKNILFDTLDKNCDELFWKNVREHICKKDITPYELLKPLTHQIPIISECISYYEKENTGKLFMACGSGKTFLSYWLSVRELKCNKIFIVVPSLYLLSI